MSNSGSAAVIFAAAAAAESNTSGESDTRCHKMLRVATCSPVAIDHAFCEGFDTQRMAVLPMVRMSLLFVYSELVFRNLWNTRFHSGGGTGFPDDPATVRTLATHHLDHPSTDAWNVVAGAVALAQGWAVPASELPRRNDDGYDFAVDTRIRLAVCLSVAWKFQRALSTHFPRRFYTREPTLTAPHTHELAYIGYAFMNINEQGEFGEWTSENAANIRALYHKMAALEIDLIVKKNVMVLLTQNAQVLAEDRIATLLAANVVSAHASMAMRAIVPLFVIAAEDGTSTAPSAGALACAAMLCVSVPTTVRPYVFHCPKTVVSHFTLAERRGAYGVIDQALHPRGLAALTLASTCYHDDGWVHYPFVCRNSLRIALGAACEVCG